MRRNDVHNPADRAYREGEHVGSGAIWADVRAKKGDATLNP
jgi:hypothetical protein